MWGRTTVPTYPFSSLHGHDHFEEHKSNIICLLLAALGVGTLGVGSLGVLSCLGVSDDRNSGLLSARC